MEGYVLAGQLVYVNTDKGIIRVQEPGEDRSIEIEAQEGVLKPEDYDPKTVVLMGTPRLGDQVRCIIIDDKLTNIYPIEPVEE